MRDLSRPLLTCRLAERWRTDGHRSLGRSVKQRLTVRARWARHHTERCAHCRNEIAESVWVERLLRRIDAPEAPPQVYEAVIARIAESPRRSAETGQKLVRRDPLGAGFGAPHLPVAVGTAFLGCLAAIGVVSFGSIASPHTFDPVWSGFVMWWDYASNVIALVQAAWSEPWAALSVMVPAIPPKIQPYFSALVWTGVGLVITAALMRGPRWPKLWFSDSV